MNKVDFIKGVERLINPIEIGTLHFMQFFNNLLPKRIQKKLVNLSSKKSSYMGFVVEPYSTFLCYEIKDIKLAGKMLPKGFKLIKCKIYKEDIPKYYAVFGCINAHTSAFFGIRVEFYLMAENENTGLLSWMIIDYDSNTISYDERNGLSNPNSSKSILTTDYNGNVIADIIRDDKTRRLSFNYNINKSKTVYLDQRFWLEGNLSIGYGKSFSETGNIFSLKFNHEEVEKALKINNINIEENTWFKNIIKDKPDSIICFPYAQHFISDSPGHSSNLNSKEELEKSLNNINFNKIKVFSTKSFKLMIIIGGLLSFLITIILLIIIII